MASRADGHRPGAPQGDLAALESITGDDLSTLQFDELLPALAERLADVCGAELGAVLLLERTGELGPLVVRHLDHPEVSSPPCAARSFATRLVQEGRPLAFAELGPSPGETEPDRHPCGVQSLLGAPLKVSRRTIGAAYVGMSRPCQFSEHELQRFMILADRAALAIEHTRLLEESQRHAAELERANQELRAVDQLKSEFLSMVSHELRTPLTAILGYTDLLLRQVHGPLNERQLRYEHSVRTGAKRLLMLVNDLLDVSRLEGGRFELDREPAEIAPILQQALNAVLVDAQSKGIHLRLEVNPRAQRVLADCDRLLQVLNNLLSNALKFTSAGGQITLVAEPYGENEACISVQDTGVGIAPKHLHRIWDHFYQADSTIRRVHGGTGLGLTIVKGLVELHGGRVWADSPGPGCGSTFSFTLPLAPAAIVQPVVLDNASRDGLSVLIVEDEPDNREVLRTIAETLVGLKVMEASNGIEALDLVERHRPDLVILDLMIPSIDGFEVARRLKANPRVASIPILAVSALARPDDQDRAFAAGVDAYIAKPFEADELAELLRRIASSVATPSR